MFLFESLKTFNKQIQNCKTLQHSKKHLKCIKRKSFPSWVDSDSKTARVYLD